MRIHGKININDPAVRTTPKILSAMAVTFLGMICKPISMTIGFIYPAYESYKALESKRTDAAAEWLTYWVIFSLFSVFESVADWLISWIPFYYILKLLFLLWLLLPRFKGASKLYNRFLQPLIQKHEAKIDQKLNEGYATAMSLSSRGLAFGNNLLNRRP